MGINDEIRPISNIAKLIASLCEVGATTCAPGRTSSKLYRSFLMRPATIKSFIQKMTNLLKRRIILGRLDTISDIMMRNPGFADLVNRIRESGTNKLDHFKNGYLFEGGLCLQQNPHEFAALCIYLREHGPYINYLEIGSASAGACLFLSREVGFTNIFSIDDGNHPDAKYQEENFGQLSNIRRYIGDSHSDEAITFLRNNVRGKLDIAFLDGDHSYSGVWQDLQLTLSFSRTGTLVIFHDTIACDGVQKAWLRCNSERLTRPHAEYIGEEVPLGIGVAEVI